MDKQKTARPAGANGGPLPTGPAADKRAAARARLRQKKRWAKAKAVADVWVVVVFTPAGGFEAKSLVVGKEAALAAAGKNTGIVSFAAPVMKGRVVRGRPYHVTVRRADNADLAWRIAAVWGTRAAAEKHAAGPAPTRDAGISTAFDVIAGTVTL